MVSVGTFDGLHQGHRRILGTMKKMAKEIGGETLVFTFDPHPRSVLAPKDNNLRLLTTKSEKIELLKNAGIDHLVFFPFSKEFSSISFLDFVRNILIGKLNAAHLILGFDHHFGRGREGNFESLKQYASEMNLGITRVEALRYNTFKIGSTEIRKSITEGELETANNFLSYPYTLIGKVVYGKQLGRTIGFPTANVQPEPLKLIPGFGVYAVWVEYKNAIYKGMLNIGVKPTVDKVAGEPTIEVNILGFEGDLYGETIMISFIKKIRNEIRFNGLPQLVDQLKKDRDLVDSILQMEHWLERG